MLNTPLRSSYISSMSSHCKVYSVAVYLAIHESYTPWRNSCRSLNVFVMFNTAVSALYLCPLDLHVLLFARLLYSTRQLFVSLETHNSGIVACVRGLFPRLLFLLMVSILKNSSKLPSRFRHRLLAYLPERRRLKHRFDYREVASLSLDYLIRPA